MILIKESWGHGCRLLGHTRRRRGASWVLEAEREWVRLMLLHMWASGGRPARLIRAECNITNLPRCLLNYVIFLFIFDDLLLKLLEQLMLWLNLLHSFMRKDGHLTHLRLLLHPWSALIVQIDFYLARRCLIPLLNFCLIIVVTLVFGHEFYHRWIIAMTTVLADKVCWLFQARPLSFDCSLGRCRSDEGFIEGNLSWDGSCWWVIQVRYNMLYTPPPSQALVQHSRHCCMLLQGVRVGVSRVSCCLRYFYCLSWLLST